LDLPHKLQLGWQGIHCPLNRRREAWERLKATREGYKTAYVLVGSSVKQRVRKVVGPTLGKCHKVNNWEEETVGKAALG